MVSATMVQSLSEALAITQAYGISPQLLGQAISRNVIASPLAAFKLPLMAEARLFHPLSPWTTCGKTAFTPRNWGGESEKGIQPRL